MKGYAKIINIETDYQNYITCPHCGWKDKNSWQKPNKGIMDCKECNRSFKYTRDEVYVYTTKKEVSNANMSRL